MNLDKYANKKMHAATLLLGMLASIAFFAVEQYLAAAATIIFAVCMLAVIKHISETPIEDERDLSIAKDSIFKAFTWTGVVLGVVMIGISIGLGTGYLDSYPDHIAPYYLTWGSIMLVAILIQKSKRLAGFR